MREILFRGKTPSGEWVEGDYVTDMFTKTPFINTSRNGYEKILPETVGQFTGLILSGTKVFEDDIVKREYTLYHGENKRTRETQIGVVWYSNRHCNFEIKGKRWLGKPFKGDTLEVIGNIHDNPELLGGADNG